MGCDGGTIPRRDELVRTKKKAEQKDKVADLAAKWKHCAITQEPLREPIMACELGRLYNKESVLELLIDRSKFECAASFTHLRGLKDVKELALTENKDFTKNKSEKGDGYIDTQAARFICPVVGIEMNGSHKHVSQGGDAAVLITSSESSHFLPTRLKKNILDQTRFCYLWKCGCTLSERALKEVRGENCPKCGKPYTKEDVVVLNPSEEELEGIKARMEEKRLQQKLEKKAKKAKKQKCETVTSEDTDCAPSTSKQPKLDQSASTSKLTNGDTASGGEDKLTNGDKASQDKLTNGSKVSKLSKDKLTNGSAGKLNGLSNGLKKTGSIQSDPKASKAYKSIFCSSDKAKNQMKAHWVTYNPYWN